MIANTEQFMEAVVGAFSELQESGELEIKSYGDLANALLSVVASAYEVQLVHIMEEDDEATKH